MFTDVCCLPTLGLAAILLRQLLLVDVRQERSTDRAPAGADHVELRKRLGGEDGLECPEHPGHEGGHVDEELHRLCIRASAGPQAQGSKESGAQGTRGSGSGRCLSPSLFLTFAC